MTTVNNLTTLNKLFSSPTFLHHPLPPSPQKKNKEKRKKIQKTNIMPVMKKKKVNSIGINASNLRGACAAVIFQVITDQLPEQSTTLGSRHAPHGTTIFTIPNSHLLEKLTSLSSLISFFRAKLLNSD